MYVRMIQFHESKGVTFHMTSSVSRLSPSPSSPSSVGSVTIKSQSGEEKTLEADVVVMGVGVAPATQYLKDSPAFASVLEEKTGAVPVDECLRVKGVGEGVYAIGMWPPFGFPRR